MTRQQSESWSPSEYLKFASERSRPAADLLARIPIPSPARVYDLGCGPGNSTALLREAYPGAEIVGVDRSEEMLAEARRAVPSCRFVAAALEEWLPEETPDLLFSNAAFQWVRGHVEVFIGLVATLREGGVLAVQMPDNLREPSHLLMLETAASGPWSGKLKGAGGAREAIRRPEHYYDALKSHVTSLEIWHTVYQHPLEGPSAIVEFLASTALRPFFDPLDEQERERFRAAFEARLATAYPARTDGKVLFRFPRIFLVAVR